MTFLDPPRPRPRRVILFPHAMQPSSSSSLHVHAGCTVLLQGAEGRVHSRDVGRGLASGWCGWWLDMVEPSWNYDRNDGTHPKHEHVEGNTWTFMIDSIDISENSTDVFVRISSRPTKPPLVETDFHGFNWYLVIHDAREDTVVVVRHRAAAALDLSSIGA